MWALPDVAGGPTEANPQDGLVNKLDLEFILMNPYFLARVDCPGCCRGDINRDGYIDIDDMLIVLSVFGNYDSRTFERCHCP